MPNEILEKFKIYLNKIGLNEKEIKIYLFMITREPQLISAIAKGCNTTRTHAYDIISELEKLGLCHSLGSEYGKRIKASSISQVFDMLEQKEKELSSLKKELKNFAPLLDSVSFTPQSRTNTAYFSGVENLKKLINIPLRSNSKIVRMAGSELALIRKLGEEFFISYHSKRKDRKIFQKTLLPGPKKYQNNIFTNDLEYLRETRLRPEGEIRLKSNIVIWESCTAIITLGDESFGTLIENNELSLMMMSWFDFIWDKSKKI